MNDIASSTESIHNTFNVADISSVLNESGVRKHFRKMYRIGSVAMHESAFAVYQKNDNLDVSKLLLPNITSQDMLDEATIKQHHDIDVSSLIISPGYSGIDLDDDSTYKISELSESARRKITAIKNVDFLDEYGKKCIIEGIIEKERDRNNNISKYRTDMVLLCHNHPQLPTVKTHPYNIIYPSATDLRMYDKTRTVNTNIVNGIVASDGKNHRLILYKAKDNTITNPEEYDNRREIDNGNTVKRLGSLAICNYSYAILELMDTGEVSKISLKNLNQFSLNTLSI